MEKELLTCPWCGRQMRFDADSVHCWYKCDNCFSNSPKARRLWDNSKTNKENWDINKAKALSLIERSNAKSSRWISVEERLPEFDIDVLVCATGNFGSVITITNYSDRLYGFNIKGWVPPWQYFHKNYTITNWMPLPEPPKEEE